MCITFKSHVSHNELIMNSLRYFDFGASRSLLLLIARIAVVILFILFGYPKLLGFDGTVQYMAASGAPMPTLAAIIAVIMEVPAAILIVLGFFPPAGGHLYFLHPGHGGDWPSLLGYDWRCGIAEHD